MSGKSELVIFGETLPQVVIENGIFCDINPNSGISSDTIEFVINSSQNEYLDLNDTLLYLKLKVLNSDGSNLSNASKASPSNFLLNALFSDVVLYLNNTVIEGGSPDYAHKATIESIFNFNDDARRLQLLPAGYTDVADEGEKWVKESKEFELCGALRLNFMNQPKYLLPSVDVKILLKRNKSEFCITLPKDDAAVNPKIEIMKATLYVRKVKVSPAVQLGHQLGLLKQNAVYPYTKSKVVTNVIPTGSLSFTKDNLFSHTRLPKFVVVCMVNADACNGSYKADPFYFDHFKVLSLGLYRDGQSLPFREIYEPDFEKNLYTKEFVKSIIHNTEHLNTNLNNGISMQDFKNGYTFFTFNLTPDFSMCDVQQPASGNLRLDIKFRAVTVNAINVITYGMYDSEIQITKNREIIL